MYIKFEKNKCLVEGCNNEITSAHAISSRISLNSIVEKDEDNKKEFNHLYHFNPQRNGELTKAPLIAKIGINEASASQCFCKTHDEIFLDLDNKGINTLYDVLLQAYRSLSILFNNEKNALLETHHYNIWDKPELISVEDVKTFLAINKQYTTLLNYLDNKEIISSVQKKMVFEISEYVDEELERIESLSFDIMKLLKTYSTLIDENDDIIKYNILNIFTTENMNYDIFYYMTDFQIPLAINTMRPLLINKKIYNYYFVIVPFENKTIIIGITPKELIHANKDIADYINMRFSSKLEVLEFVESIMMTSDDWYIKPSIIRDDMSEEKRKILEEDCMFINERLFYQPYDLSIFDKLRKSICDEMNLTDEKQKLSYLPQREDYKIRYKRMLQKIIDSSFVNYCLF